MTTRAAVSLVEVIIASAIFGTMMLMVSQSVDMGNRMRERIALQNDLTNRANDVLNKIALQLRDVKNDGGAAATLKLPDTANSTATRIVYSYTLPLTSDATRTGIGNVTTQFNTVYETDTGLPVRQLIYDKTAGTLTRVTPATGSGGELLCSDIPTDGFTLFQVGTTLQMTLKLQTATSRKITGMATGEDIIYTAQAKTLFMRAALAQNTGSAPITEVPSPDNPDPYYSYVGSWTEYGPSLAFGNLITELSNSKKQITIFISPPIATNAQQMELKPEDIYVYCWVPETWDAFTWSGGDMVLDGGSNYYLERVSHSLGNGSYAITLEGTISGPIQVYADVWQSWVDSSGNWGYQSSYDTKIY